MDETFAASTMRRIHELTEQVGKLARQLAEKEVENRKLKQTVARLERALANQEQPEPYLRPWRDVRYFCELVPRH